MTVQRDVKLSQSGRAVATVIVKLSKALLLQLIVRCPTIA